LDSGALARETNAGREGSSNGTGPERLESACPREQDPRETIVCEPRAFGSSAASMSSTSICG
jgi:hypothetical protein